MIYVEVLKAIYGMLQAALLWYKQFRADLEAIGFQFNKYDPCVANKMVEGKQHTVRFHVDDLMSSHIDSKVNDKFQEWLQKTYGSVNKVQCTRGKKHVYLGMTVEFHDDGSVTLDMRDYISNMINDFPMDLTGKKASSPGSGHLFSGPKGAHLYPKRKEQYHHTVAQGLYVAKRARQDLLQTIAVLSTRVRQPTEGDWEKLVRLMKYINGTKRKVFRFSVDDLRILKWYVDVAFAVHPDFKSHTGMVMTMGQGALQSMSRKQKLNTRSSTEAELVGADDVVSQMLWTQLFLEEQGYLIEKNILYQDNKSTILLETNGRKSAGKRSRALNVRYFFIADQVEKGKLIVEYCPTDEMVGDYMTKPLQGRKFEEFVKTIMGES